MPQAAQLLETLASLGRTVIGLALLSGLRGGELFALRWCDVEAEMQCLMVRQALYEGTFDTPKTAAGVRQVPLSGSARHLLIAWRSRSARVEQGPIELAERIWLLGLDSVPLTVSEANRGATTEDSPERHRRERSEWIWLAALEAFRNWLIPAA